MTPTPGDDHPHLVNEVDVRVHILGEDAHPEELHRVLGLESSSVSTPRARRRRWSWKSTPGDSAETPIEEFLIVFDDSRLGALTQWAKGRDVEIDIKILIFVDTGLVLDTSDEYSVLGEPPPIILPPRLLALLGRHGLEFNVDITLQG